MGNSHEYPNLWLDINDAPDFMAKKQFEIVFAKPITERLKVVDGLFCFNRQLAVEWIQEAHPTYFW